MMDDETLARELNIPVDLVSKITPERRAMYEQLIGVKSLVGVQKAAAQARAWGLWLDCHSEREVADAIGVPQPTIHGWLDDRISNSLDFRSPPPSRQHFDVWSFQTADKDAGQQSYFGALPPQVMENLLWFFGFIRTQMVRERHVGLLMFGAAG
jgi:hypothetical protein